MNPQDKNLVENLKFFPEETYPKAAALHVIDVLGPNIERSLRDEREEEVAWWLKHFALRYPNLAPRAVRAAVLDELKRRQQ